MTPQDLVNSTGQHLLFLGVSTYSWSLAQFQQAAQFARAHGVDNLLVKVADGGNEWYGSSDFWTRIRQTILNEGVGVIPYIYSYANKFGALDAEISIMLYHMQESGVLCMNAEVEWNNDVASAKHLCYRITSESRGGIFLVSTWADPSLQDWQGVIAALAPCTTVFMPQQYNNYLATFWGEFGAHGANWLQPTVNLTQDFGPNDPVTIAKNAYGQGHTAISVWYYDTAVANPGLLDAVYAAFPKGGNNTMIIPQDWTDDGQTLTAPNGHKVVLGFRDYVLSHNWDTNNVPMEDEHEANPVEDYYDQAPNNAGSRQMFLYCELAYTAARGVYIVGIGNELMGTRHDRDIFKTSLAIAQTEIDSNPAVEKVRAFKQALSDLASV